MPDRPVVALTGDGGFLFGGAELATAVQFGINLVTVLFNNSSYGNVLRDQRRMFEGRDSGSKLRNPGLPDVCEELSACRPGVPTTPTVCAARCVRR